MVTLAAVIAQGVARTAGRSSNMRKMCSVVMFHSYLHCFQLIKVEYSLMKNSCVLHKRE